jgi:hypothetical protein
MGWYFQELWIKRPKNGNERVDKYRKGDLPDAIAQELTLRRETCGNSLVFALKACGNRQQSNGEPVLTWEDPSANAAL